MSLNDHRITINTSTNKRHQTAPVKASRLANVLGAVIMNTAGTTTADKSETQNTKKKTMSVLSWLLIAGNLSRESPINPTKPGKRNAKLPTDHFMRDEYITQRGLTIIRPESLRPVLFQAFKLLWVKILVQYILGKG